MKLSKRKSKNITTIIIISLLAIYAIYNSFSGESNDTTGRVVKVSDGDTFTLLTKDLKQIKVRMYGIDAPESKQAFGEKSRLFLAGMIAGKEVVLEIKDTDKYGRTVAKVKTDNVEDVGLEMLKAGMAWHYSYYDKTKAYIQAEKEAKEKKVGLWIDKNPINPYDFRKRNS